jgi:hypothetical protein
MEENILVLKEVQPLDSFCLHVEYSDGVEGKVDLSEFAGKGVFKLWTDYSQFEKVAIGSSGELAWSEDVDGLGIYLKLTGKKPEDVLPKLRERSHRCHQSVCNPFQRGRMVSSTDWFSR